MPSLDHVLSQHCEDMLATKLVSPRPAKPNTTISGPDLAFLLYLELAAGHLRHYRNDVVWYDIIWTSGLPDSTFAVSQPLSARIVLRVDPNLKSFQSMFDAAARISEGEISQ